MVGLLCKSSVYSVAHVLVTHIVPEESHDSCGLAEAALSCPLPSRQKVFLAFLQNRSETHCDSPNVPRACMFRQGIAY